MRFLNTVLAVVLASGATAINFMDGATISAWMLTLLVWACFATFMFLLYVADEQQ